MGKALKPARPVWLSRDSDPMSGVSLSRSPRPARAVSGPGRPLAARVGRSRAPEAHRLSGGDHGLCEATHCWPCRAGTKSLPCMKDDTMTNFDWVSASSFSMARTITAFRPTAGPARSCTLATAAQREVRLSFCASPRECGFSCSEQRIFKIESHQA